MKVDQLETFLRRASCFAVLTDEQLRTLRDRAELRAYGLGQVVFRQNDPGDRMYLVYSGKARVLREVDGREVPLNVLYPGDHFGEVALVSGQPRSATVRSAGDSTLVSIPADAIGELLETSGELRTYFENYADRLELWNFIKLIDRFGTQLRPEQLRRLVDQFQGEEHAAGETILAAGDVPRRFRLIQSGRVKVEQDGKLYATLTAGDSFGAGPLLTDPPGESRWTFTADGPVQLLSLCAEEFRALLEELPALRRFFNEQLAHYQADDADEHFGEVSARLGASAPPAPQTEDDEAAMAESTALGEVAPAATERTVEVAVEESAQEPPLEELPPRPPLNFWRRWWFPYSPQHEETDCGAACLAMITAFHGHSVGVSRLRDLAGVGVEGASLAQLSAAAHEIGYRTRAVRMSADRLDQLRLPAVIYWRGYHYVVLYALTDSQAYIADPAVGKLRMDRPALAESYSGYALEVEPTDEAQKIRARDSATGQMLKLLRGHWLVLAGIIVATLVLKLCEYVFVVFTETIVDRLKPHQGLGAFHQILTLVVLVAALQIVLTIWQGLTSARLSNALDRSMMGSFYMHLLSLPTRYFKLRRIGDIVARFGDNAKIRALFTGGALTMIIELPTMFVWFYLMFQRNVELTLVVLAFMPLLAGFTLVTSPIMKRHLRRMIEDSAAQESNQIEAIQGVDLVKSMAVEQPFQKKWHALFDHYLRSSYRYQKTSQIFSAAGSSLHILSTLVLLWYGAVLVEQGEEVLTIGELVAFTMLAPMALAPVMKLIGLWDELQEARVSLERLSDVLDSDPEPQPPEDQRVYPEIVRGHVKFDRVYFHYGGRDASYVLRNVSFEARPGQCIAVVGRSGSGKTTLARLLLGLYQPTEGHVMIDGWDVRDVDLTTFRRQAGVVLQENLLFSGTIRDNIAMGEEHPDEQRLVEVSQLAGVQEFVSRMPLRFDTVVGEMGLTLSGGQRQRIALARALYRNPRLLVLDEATSALDSLSEREIQRNMETILRDRTAIVIAHKIATVRGADQILVLHEGTIVERGRHDELIAQRGTYYYLAAQQLNL